MTQLQLHLILVFGLAASLGCTKTNEPDTTTTPQPVAAKAPEPQLDDATNLFLQRVAAFADEARSAANLLDLNPEPDAYKKKIATLTDVFSRIPDPPPGNQGLADQRKDAQQILGRLNVPLAFMALDELGGPPSEQSNHEMFHKISLEQKAKIGELEVGIKAIRGPVRNSP